MKLLNKFRNYLIYLIMALPLLINYSVAKSQSIKKIKTIEKKTNFNSIKEFNENKEKEINWEIINSTRKKQKTQNWEKLNKNFNLEKYIDINNIRQSNYKHRLCNSLCTKYWYL